jgi:hypothetical protein
VLWRDAATTDPDKVERFWTRNPSANIGLPCGHLFDVLDVDVSAGKPGLVSLARLKAAGLLEGAWAYATTPSGGYHVLFAPTEGLTNKAAAGLGLDVRALGGYIVGAPSVRLMPDGATAKWLWAKSRPHLAAAGIPWGAVKALLDPPKPPKPLTRRDGTADPASLAEWLRGQGEGNRNAGLYWAACRTLEDGGDPHALEQAALDIGLEPGEIAATIASAVRRVR